MRHQTRFSFLFMLSEIRVRTWTFYICSYDIISRNKPLLPSLDTSS